MIQLNKQGTFFHNGAPCPTAPVTADEGRRQTMAWHILQSHNTSGDPAVPCASEGDLLY